MDRLRVALLGLLTASCGVGLTAGLIDPRPTNGYVWGAHELCVVGDWDDSDAAELADLTDLAVDAWGVRDEGWSVTRIDWRHIDEQYASGASLGCVPVYLAGALEVQSWPPQRAAQTMFWPDSLQPVIVAYDRAYWRACPRAHTVLVLHEIGHAVGHVEHTVRDGVMRPEVDCDAEPIDVDTRARETAARRRQGLPL